MTSITRRGALTLIGGTVLAAPFVRRARAEGTLNVYNWANYIGETTLEDFQKATGISVTYDNFASLEELSAKMLAGSTGYDVVFQGGMDSPIMFRANVYDTLDKSKLPSWSNLDPTILKLVAGWDPDNAHGVPYMWGSVGMTFNVDMVKERIPDADMDSLDILFKPENAEKLADCGISILDSPTNIMLMALKYLGRNPDSATEEDYKAAAELFKPIRKYIRTFDNSNFLNALPNKELCVVNNWSGDYATATARAEDAGVDVNLAYYVPKSGAPLWCDLMCVPADSQNKDNAYKFLEFMLQPEVIGKCSNATNYANANLKAGPFVSEKIRSNQAIYPNQEMMQRLYTPQTLSEEQLRVLTRIWVDVKTGA
jgi:putrescine transport system substrate-binding protein